MIVLVPMTLLAMEAVVPLASTMMMAKVLAAAVVP